MALPKDPTTVVPAATDAATEPADSLELDVKSSRQLKAAGIEVDDWEAKYNGLVGSTKQLVTKFNTALAGKDAEIDGFKTQLSDASKQLKELKALADSVPELKTQLDTATAAHVKADAESKKQGVLLKFPTLLTPTKDGKTNPLMDVLMASNLPIDQFEAKAAELAALDWGSSARRLDGSVPPPAPPVTDADSADGWQQKALAAHEKFIASGRKDKQAEADEKAAWAQSRRLSQK